MIYITGDIHGNVRQLEETGAACHLTAEDSLIIAGDFGCIFNVPSYDEPRLEVLKKLPYTVLFLDGNHECFPKICSYPEEMWNGGRIHRILPNVIHLMRGQVYTLDGLKVFTMGGGYSIDRAMRVQGYSWWPEEMPSEEEYDEGRRNLEANGNKVDVIISHAAPEGTMQMFAQTGLFTRRYPEEWPLNFFLENVRSTIEHDRYYFGHMHIDRELFRKQTALYWNVREFATGNVVYDRSSTMFQVKKSAPSGEAEK